MRLVLLALAVFLIQQNVEAQQTFQNTQFDLSADLPAEDPTVLAQVEGVPTHHLKNELKPVKIQKPAAAAVAAQLPQPQPQPAPASLPTIAPFTLPSMAPFTFPTHAPFPTHPPLPTLAPFTFPTLPPHPTIAPFTFPTPAPAPAASAAPPSPAAPFFPAPAIPGGAPEPQAADYDEPVQRIAPTTTSKPQTAQPQQPHPQPQTQPQAQQNNQSPVLPAGQLYNAEYVRYVQQYYPEHFRQHQQFYMTHIAQPQVQQVQPQQPVVQPTQPQRPVPFAQVQPHQPIVQPPPQQQQFIRPAAPQQPLVNGVQTAVGVAPVAPVKPVFVSAVVTATSAAPKIIQLEQTSIVKSATPTRAANWFREQSDTKDCKKDLKKVALLFKNKFPAYLQKGGKDAALAELVEKRLVECDEKGTTGHWDKVDSLLGKIQLSKSEESECRAGLIQERISCHNLLNFSCQFTNSSYQFKLVPARIVIQEARQAEGGAEKCRKVVRLVKKRLEG